MVLLKEYSLTNLDNDSFTSIFVDEPNKNSIIQPKRLQVIIEFLFFMRDKSIDIIHLLNKQSALYFPLLNRPNILKDINNNDKEINNINIMNKDENQNNINYNEKNMELFNKIKVNLKENILCRHAFLYLFQEKMELDYKKEVEYLINNIIIPHNLTKELDYITAKMGRITCSLLECKKKIEKLYKILDNSFKKFPLYPEIITYFENTNNIINNPQIDYYEKYVEGFKEYGQLYDIKKTFEKYDKIEVKDVKKKYTKLIEEYEQFKEKKEKCNYIKNNIGSFLINHFIDYNNYYEEWKKKNPNFVVDKYDFKDLIADVQLLLPLTEKINLIGRDKFNFSFLLYLCQNNYFLKDCI